MAPENSVSDLCCEVMDVDCFPVQYRSAGSRAASEGLEAVQVASGHIGATIRKIITIDAIDKGIACFTQPRGIFRDHIQHRLDIRRRAGDHAQYFTRRGLLLQCFGEITIARLLLVNKPRVLDRDHRLIGEGFEQLDLPVRERTDLSSANMNSADGHTFA